MAADQVLAKPTVQRLRLPVPMDYQQSTAGSMKTSPKVLVTRGTVTASRYRGHLLMLAGFAFGFAMAFTSLSFYDRKLFACDEMIKFTTTSGNDDYNGWPLHEPTVEETRDLHQVLFDEVRIVCMVLTCPKYHEERAAHIRATWGRRCNKLVFISNETDAQYEDIVAIGAGGDYTELWNKTRLGLQYVFEEFYEDYDWFLKADDDTYVIVENLRYMLSAYHPETPVYFGHLLQLYNETYMSGGAGYVLSKEALRRFANQTKSPIDNASLCPLDYPVEDFALGRCLRNVGVYLLDSKEMAPMDDKPKFFPLDLESFVNPNAKLQPWLFDMTPRGVELGLSCCSKYSIAFHYVRPAYLYHYEFVIYELRAFGVHKPYGKLPRKYSTRDIKSMLERNVKQERTEHKKMV